MPVNVHRKNIIFTTLSVRTHEHAQVQIFIIFGENSGIRALKKKKNVYPRLYRCRPPERDGH
jgi:hypothetical protein